jgi:hypothetical protein
MIALYVSIALSHPATTYGWGEVMCGDVHSPRACDNEATTASGEPFQPDIPSAAVPAPFNVIMPSKIIWLRDEQGECRSLTLNDKKHPRFIASGGLDLSKGAIEMLYPSTASRTWSGKVEACTVQFSTIEIDLK